MASTKANWNYARENINYEFSKTFIDEIYSILLEEKSNIDEPRIVRFLIELRRPFSLYADRQLKASGSCTKGAILDARNKIRKELKKISPMFSGEMGGLRSYLEYALADQGWGHIFKSENTGSQALITWQKLFDELPDIIQKIETVLDDSDEKITSAWHSDLYVGTRNIFVREIAIAYQNALCIRPKAYCSKDDESKRGTFAQTLYACFKEVSGKRISAGDLSNLVMEGVAAAKKEEIWDLLLIDRLSKSHLENSIEGTEGTEKLTVVIN